MGGRSGIGDLGLSERSTEYAGDDTTLLPTSSRPYLELSRSSEICTVQAELLQCCSPLPPDAGQDGFLGFHCWVHPVNSIYQLFGGQSCLLLQLLYCVFKLFTSDLLPFYITLFIQYTYMQNQMQAANRFQRRLKAGQPAYGGWQMLPGTNLTRVLCRSAPNMDWAPSGSRTREYLR